MKTEIVGSRDELRKLSDKDLQDLVVHYKIDMSNKVCQTISERINLNQLQEEINFFLKNYSVTSDQVIICISSSYGDDTIELQTIVTLNIKSPRDRTEIIDRIWVKQRNEFHERNQYEILKKKFEK